MFDAHRTFVNVYNCYPRSKTITTSKGPGSAHYRFDIDTILRVAPLRV